MNAGAFLRDRAAALAAAVLCSLGTASVCWLCGAGASAAVVAGTFSALCWAAALAFEYARRRRFYAELQAATRTLDEAYLAAALIEEPGFLEGEIAYEAIEAAGKAAADLVAERDAQAKDYRDYIELWIHEVKTPIAACRLVAARLHGPDAERLRFEVDRIEAEVEQALFYARSTSLAQDYAVREVALADVVRGVCKRHARYLVEHGTVPRIDVPDGVRVLADASWLGFVLGQVVANAAKYGASTLRFSVSGGADAGAPSADAPGAHGGAAGPRSIVLEVADDGQGIPAADVPRVFDRGFTGENGRQAGRSTGMGLYLVAVMCEKMGLGLGIASEEGRGTRVMVTFPYDRQRSAAANLTGV